MDALEHNIVSKIDELRELLNYSLRQTPVFLPVIRQIKAELSLCECALDQVNAKRAVERRA